jgi:hypothetical protein
MPVAVVKKFLICEDARLEMSGKQIIIGVYPDDLIVVPKFPVDVLFAFWIVVTPLELGSHTASIEIVDESGAVPTPRGRGGATFNFVNYADTTVTIPNISVHVERTADLACKIQFGMGPWVTMGLLKVMTPDQVQEAIKTPTKRMPHS